MNLETINKEYEALNKSIEKASEDIEKIEIRANDLEMDKAIWKGEWAKAKKNGDQVAEKKAETELKKIDSEIEMVKDLALTKREEIKNCQDKINARIAEIRSNPDMQEHFDQIMEKKYNREISKLAQEKVDSIAKRGRLSELQRLETQHPTLANNLTGILGATQEIKNLEKELNDMIKTIAGGLIEYKDPVRAQEIMQRLMPQAQSKLIKNKTNLMNYIQKNSLNIDEKDIDDLADKGFKVDDKGNIDLNMTINKNVSHLNRKIKGYDKSIKDRQIAVDNIDLRQQPIHIVPDPQTTTQPTQSKPKWYQFVKRFKNWNEKRKQQSLPQQNTTNQNTNQKTNKFKDSMKYEIVQMAAKQKEEEDLKQAKQQRKSQGIQR